MNIPSALLLIEKVGHMDLFHEVTENAYVWKADLRRSKKMYFLVIEILLLLLLALLLRIFSCQFPDIEYYITA